MVIFKTRIFILICLIGIFHPGQAKSQTSNFYQLVDVSNYQGDGFTFTCWVHATFLTDNSYLLPMSVIFKNDTQLSLFKGKYVHVSSNSWNELSVSGTIGKQASSMGVGIAYGGEGKYYFDDMKLIVQTKKIEVTLPLENSSFESANTNPWTFLYTPQNASTSLTTQLAYSGKQSLFINTSSEQTSINGTHDTKVFNANDSIASAKAKQLLLDTIVDIFQTRSIYNNRENWDELKPQLYKSIDYSASNSAKAIIPAYIKLSKILNITHGGLRYEGKNYGAFNEDFREILNRIPDSIREAAQKKEYNFRTEIIDKKYGYISIPPIEIQYSEDMEKVKQELKKKASVIQDSLCKLNIAGLKGIILDLRLNNGGSSVSMIGALNSLYNNGTLFNFVMANGTIQKVVKGKTYITFDKDTLVKLEPKCPVLNTIKLAVLISPYTASAAEQTAISFEGRDNTILVGERTAGMTTGVKTILIGKELTLDYAEGYAEDRNGKIYENGVSPNIKVAGGEDFENLNNDKKVQEAIKWFKEQR